MCVTSAIGRIFFGRLCDWIPSLFLCHASIMFLAFCSILFPFLKSYAALVIVSVISGFPDGAFIASLPTITTQIVGTERMSEGFGFMLFCQSYSNVMGPPLAGTVPPIHHTDMPTLLTVIVTVFSERTAFCCRVFTSGVLHTEKPVKP